MKRVHPQEDIIKTYDINGSSVELVRRKESIWCGKVGYAVNNVDEPDVESIAEDARVIFSNNTPNDREANWEV